MSDYGELRLPPVVTHVNKQTGRYMKGHVPANKGKKWSEWMSKRGARRSAKGWANIDKFRCKGNPEWAERKKRKVVAVRDDGTWSVFGCILDAAAWMEQVVGVKCCRENIGRCCRENASKRVKTRAWCSRGHGVKGVTKSEGSLVNTDHRYRGIRWYYENDDVWTTKIIRG